MPIAIAVLRIVTIVVLLTTFVYLAATRTSNEIDLGVLAFAYGLLLVLLVLLDYGLNRLPWASRNGRTPPDGGEGEGR